MTKSSPLVAIFSQPCVSLQLPDGSTDSAVWEYTEGDDFSSDNLAGEYFKVYQCYCMQYLLRYFKRIETPTDFRFLDGLSWRMLFNCIIVAKVDFIKRWGRTVRAAWAPCTSADCCCRTSRKSSCSWARPPRCWPRSRTTRSREWSRRTCRHPSRCRADRCMWPFRAGAPWGARQGVGCVLCLEQDCERGGHCADVRSSYACACPPGYAGDYCQVRFLLLLC